jgi:hypothetical protein
MPEGALNRRFRDLMQIKRVGLDFADIRPPTPRSETTVCAVTMGNMAELVATVSVALLIVLLSARTIGYRGQQCNGGESVSQSPLM